jgi:hypothetical protein
MADKSNPLHQINAQAQQAADTWTKIASDLESKLIEQTRANIDEMARLWKESLSYSTQIAGEWRKLFVPAPRA